MGLLVDGVWQQDGVAHQRRPFHPADAALPQLGDARRQRRPVRRRRLCGRGRPLSSLCLAGLPLGAPHRHLPQAQGARERHLDVDRLARHAARTAGPSTRTKARPATTSTARASCRKSICWPIRNIPAASACRCCGTRSARPSSTTNRPKSSACSIRRSTPSPTSHTDYYPEALRAEIDTHQRPGLSQHQQRRLSRRLRHHAGGL